MVVSSVAFFQLPTSRVFFPPILRFPKFEIFFDFILKKVSNFVVATMRKFARETKKLPKNIFFRNFCL